MGRSPAHDLGIVVPVGDLPDVEPVEEIPVHLLEIDRRANGLADPDILEYRLAQIEKESLDVGDALVREWFFHQPVVLHQLVVEFLGPFAGTVDQHDIELGSGVHALDVVLDASGILVEAEDDGVEIVAAAVDRQILAPPIGIAFQGDVFAEVGRKGFQLVGAAADQDILEIVAEVFPGDSIDMPGQDRHLAGDQRQFLVAGVLQDETDRPVVQLLQPFHLRIIVAVIRDAARILECGKGEDDIIGGDRFPIRPVRFRIEPVGDRQAVGGDLRLFGQQSIHREWFIRIGAAGHQRLENQDGRIGKIISLQRIWIELGEPARETNPQFAAFGGIGIDAIKMTLLAPILVLQVLWTVQRHSVAGFAAPRHWQQDEGQAAKTDGFQKTVHGRKSLRCRLEKRWRTI